MECRCGRELWPASSNPWCEACSEAYMDGYRAAESDIRELGLPEELDMGGGGTPHARELQEIHEQMVAAGYPLEEHFHDGRFEIESIEDSEFEFRPLGSQKPEREYREAHLICKVCGAQWKRRIHKTRKKWKSMKRDPYYELDMAD